MKGYEIVLTADRSFMSDYRCLPFLRGLRFASTNILHSSLFFRFVSPPVPTFNGGVALIAPYHTRRTEAALLSYGFDGSQVVVVPPDKVHSFAGSDTKAVSITVRDPLSRIHHYALLNPLGKESYSSLSFKELCQKLKTGKRGYKVVAEGPGAWQLTDPGERRKFSVDHVIVGEYTTGVAPLVFKGVMEGKDVPEVVYAPNVELGEIPPIRGGVTEGFIEVAKGCNRGCNFCSVPKTKCRPLRDIVDEAEVNVRYGQQNVTLRSDDVFNYGANGLRINREAVLKLYHSVKEVRGVKRVGQCYLNLASAVSNPSLVEEVTEVIGAGSRGYPYTAVLTGIESGSPRLIEAHMPRKAWPFKPSEWHEVVEKGFSLLNDSHWVPTGMLILGLPGEREEDVQETISLVERLRPYESAFAPFIFKARSALSQEEDFNVRDLKRHHLELIKIVFDHNTYWGERLITDYMKSKYMPRWLLSMVSPIIGWGVGRAYRKLLDEIVASKNRIKLGRKI